MACPAQPRHRHWCPTAASSAGKTGDGPAQPAVKRQRTCRAFFWSTNSQMPLPIRPSTSTLPSSKATAGRARAASSTSAAPRRQRCRQAGSSWRAASPGPGPGGGHGEAVPPAGTRCSPDTGGVSRALARSCSGSKRNERGNARAWGSWGCRFQEDQIRGQLAAAEGWPGASIWIHCSRVQLRNPVYQR